MKDIDIGEELTVLFDVFDISGKTILKENDIVTIREVEYSGGYWSNFFEQYVPEVPNMVKLVGVYGSWRLDTFKEFKS